ncbi:glutathione S-transferase family protein [Hephaestia sp. GCM10023244]|uniref:glutathione S-transferase family protein n=1 Tax=unclassified Hephaestia TaxID=2631281 RepID=UPI0020775F5F|nr:glutathione S-transferase family protein [Hephaestia sp. MAHUQ-44]MCM8729915.1 glutathione S-transferase family protein [Hephaestia sp. MAHUQ-44]
MNTPIVTALDWVPDGARGLVRDLRVRWALEEVGQPYDVRLLRFGTHKEGAHRAHQPFGQVPTYEEDGLVLFESGAIVLHIAERHPGLLPDDPHGRARAIEWLFAALNSVETPITERFHAAVIECNERWADARLPIVDDRVRGRLADLSQRLGGADWLDGGFSIGDLMMVSVLRPLRRSGIVDEFANLGAYVERGEARPAFQRALRAQLADFTGQPPAGFVEPGRKAAQ